MASRPVEKKEARSSAAGQLGEQHLSKLMSSNLLTGIARIKYANDRSGKAGP